MRPLLLACVLFGCGGGDGVTPPGPKVHWSIIREHDVVGCAEIGAAKMVFEDGARFPCDAGEAPIQYTDWVRSPFVYLVDAQEHLVAARSLVFYPPEPSEISFYVGADEPVGELDQIGQLAQIAYRRDGAFPPSVQPASTPSPPMDACCAYVDNVCPVDASFWSDPAWVALGFQTWDQQHYSYAYESSASGFVARAYGDLDCDGQYSTFELSGNVSNGVVTLDPMKITYETP
jgi:hypothetical protein